MSAIRAFRTECLDVVSIVFAMTREQAAWAARTLARTAGHHVEYRNIRVLRWSEFDGRMLEGGLPVVAGQCYDPDYITFQGDY